MYLVFVCWYYNYKLQYTQTQKPQMFWLDDYKWSASWFSQSKNYKSTTRDKKMTALEKTGCNKHFCSHNSNGEEMVEERGWRLCIHNPMYGQRFTFGVGDWGQKNLHSPHQIATLLHFKIITNSKFWGPYGFPCSEIKIIFVI